MERSNRALTRPGKGSSTLPLKDSGGAGAEDTAGEIPANAHLWDWSPDSRFIVYSTLGRQRAADLWVLPLIGPGPPMTVVLNWTAALR